jgi:outer membrane biosynthesis protein TonB
MFSQNAEPVPQRPNRSSGKPNPFAHMKVYNFAPPQSQVVTHGTQPQRGLALNLAPVIRNGQLLDAVEHVSDPNASSDWLEGLNDWIAKHAYYPQSAGENGEEGDSTVEAGSRLLDVATLGIFRDQILPPFPDDMKDQDITVKLTVNYEIIRQ